MRNVNDQLHRNMTAMRANLVAEIVREFRQVPEYTSAHGGEQRGTNEDAAASNVHERRHHAAPYAGRPPGFRRRDNADAAGRGQGRGHQRANLHIKDSEDEFKENNYRLHPNHRFQRRGHYGQERHEEERFGKLKFTMPKFDGVSNPKAYLTWELKVDKIFRMHNYSEEKKLVMASLEFKDYALIWWEKV